MRREFGLIQQVERRDWLTQRFFKDTESPFALSYMGRAEFEFGTVPQSLREMLAVITDLVVNTVEINGHLVDIAWLESEGDPRGAFGDWLAAGAPTLERPFVFLRAVGYEPTHVYKRRRGQSEPLPEPARLWWSLSDHVLFGLTAEGTVPQLVDEMRAVVAQRQAENTA